MNKRAKQISTLGSRATALVSVCLVLFLLGAASLAGLAGQKLRDDARRNIGFTVMMEHECPQADFDAMKRRLMATPAIETFTYTSAEDILAQESESLGDDIAAMLGANPYSSEFEVRVRPAFANPDSVQALSERRCCAIPVLSPGLTMPSTARGLSSRALLWFFSLSA